MPVRNPDGSIYSVSGSRSQFDPENPDLLLFDLWDAEAIRIGGSPIFYYEVFIQPQTTDLLYMEDRGKIWSNDPVELYCFYEPIPASNTMTLHGIDGWDEMVFELNARDMLRTLGHPPRIGSRLFTPHKREHWEIIQREYAEWKMWGEIRMRLICKRFRESSTNDPGVADQKQPDFQLHAEDASVMKEVSGLFG